jgi:putative aldouronate transport system substrate-binding protein
MKAGLLLALFLLSCPPTEGSGIFDRSPRPGNLVEITQLAWDRGMVPPAQGTIEDNWWTRYVNAKVQRLGLKVRFVPVPRAQETQKLPLMLAAGEAPDLCFTYDRNLLSLSAKNGVLVDFTDLFTRDGQNIRKIYDQSDIAAGMIRGRLYTFVCKSNGAADTTWVREDWLEKLHMGVDRKSVV